MKKGDTVKSLSINILKITSFISSLLPLTVFLFLKYINNNRVFHNIKLLTPNNIVILLCIIQVISISYVIIYYKYFVNRRNNNYIKIRISNVKQEKSNTSNYLLSNVLPIISLDFKDMAGITFVVLIIIFLAFMYVKNNLYYINPLYDIIGIKVYSCNVKLLNDNDQEVKEINKTLISIVSLYEFNNNRYKAIENVDTIIITKEL